MLIDDVIRRQAVDVRRADDKRGNSSDERLPRLLDPFYLIYNPSYEAPLFPTPDITWRREDWQHCGFEELAQIKAAYEAFSQHKNTQNALQIAVLAIANFNWFLAACWYQIAAIYGKSNIAMAELCGILLRGLDVPRNEEAAAYWYQKSNRILSGLLLQNPRTYALEIGKKQLLKLDVFRRFTDPKDTATYQFFGRPEGKLLSIQINPTDLEGDCKWSFPEYVRSTPPGNEYYESTTKVDAWFSPTLYESAEQRLRSNSRGN